MKKEKLRCKLGIHYFSGWGKHIDLWNHPEPWKKAHVNGEYFGLEPCDYCDYIRLRRPSMPDLEIESLQKMRKKKGMRAIAIWDINKCPTDHFGKTYKDLKFKNDKCIGYK